jgi:hypothetical protein
MEFLLLWWDELDDVVGACRHLASSTVDEVAGLAQPLVTGAIATGAWLVAARFAANAHLVAAAAALLDPRA